MTMVLGVTNMTAHPGLHNNGRPVVVKKEVVVVKERCKKCDKHKDRKDKKRKVKGRDDVYRYSEVTVNRRPSRPTPPPPAPRTWRDGRRVNTTIVAVR